MSAIITADDPIAVRLEPKGRQPTRAIRLVTEFYARLVLAGFALVPAFLIAYLYFFQNPTLKFEDHAFHIMAILLCGA